MLFLYMEEPKPLILNLIELFRSVQGETSLAGLPTSFIRLAQCNLRCSWCDTPYSFGRGTPHLVEAILHTIQEYGCQNVCVTGGEPLLQKNVHPLMSKLCDRGYRVSLETGGSLCTSEVDPRVHIILDVKCPGSGMDHKNFLKNLERLQPHDQVKFVVAHQQDYQYAKEICSQFKLFERNQEVLLSPVHGQLEPKQLIEWFLNDKLPFRLNLQIHKFIWHPETKGV
jgi:7-carboxy-7-deazaguanine synthase